MTDTGIGFTTVASSRNQVCTLFSLALRTSSYYCTVLYRSKEPALPDFSKGDGNVGDIFFDVRTLHYFRSLYWIHYLKAKCSCWWRQCGHDHVSILTLWQLFRICSFPLGKSCPDQPIILLLFLVTGRWLLNHLCSHYELAIVAGIRHPRHRWSITGWSQVVQILKYNLDKGLQRISLSGLTVSAMSSKPSIH